MRPIDRNPFLAEDGLHPAVAPEEAEVSVALHALLAPARHPYDLRGFEDVGRIVELLRSETPPAEVPPPPEPGALPEGAGFVRSLLDGE